jgi:S-adenosylmethionine hydrolase
MSASVIALISDLGTQDNYVGVMKGVMLGLASDAPLVDISHQIQPGDIREAAFMLTLSFEYFPSGTVFCCVIDPGVGSDRRAVAVRVRYHERSYTFVGPDNGLVTGVLAIGDVEVATVVSLENGQFHLPVISSTFHGRDIFAPSSAHLARGEQIEALGPVLAPNLLTRLPWPNPSQESGDWYADIIYADRFGNLVTNMRASEFRASRAPHIPVDEWRVWLGDIELGPLRRTFADVAPRMPLAYVGSTGFVEIAIRNGSARESLRYDPDTRVVLRLKD